MERSLAGYYIPFRSPRLKDLPNIQKATTFSEQLWTNILRETRPKPIICIDKETYQKLSKIVPVVYETQQSGSSTLETGWGNYTASIDHFGNPKKVTLLRLPHLSTFKLFSRANCRPFLDEIFDQACQILEPARTSHGLWD